MSTRARARLVARPPTTHLLGMTVVEAAVGFAIVGSLLAVAVPVFHRELHASRFVEAALGVSRLATSAVAYAESKRIVEAFPQSTGLTPATVPRGKLEAAADGAWEAPTWKALAFEPASAGAPHAFAFGFDSTLGAARSAFVAHAHGDLDGDGLTSTFEVRGVAAATEKPRVEPGMYVEAEVE